MLWLYAIAVAIASTVAPNGSRSPWAADYASRLALSLILAAWVIADAQKRQRRLCYDYDGFVFFAWPVVVPVYLFRTRGVRAFLTLLCFAGIWLVAILAAWVVFIIREFMFS
jgi:hypothetical protein